MFDIQTANYDQLKAAQDEIGNRIRVLERAAIEEIEQRARQYGFALVPNAKASKGKYVNPDNPDETYSRGKYPRWLADKILEGHTIDDFRAG